MTDNTVAEDLYWIDNKACTMKGPDLIIGKNGKKQQGLVSDCLPCGRLFTVSSRHHKDEEACREWMKQYGVEITWNERFHKFEVASKDPLQVSNPSLESLSLAIQSFTGGPGGPSEADTDENRRLLSDDIEDSDSESNRRSKTDREEDSSVTPTSTLRSLAKSFTKRLKG